MFRKLSLAVAIAAALAPLSVQGLGLGDIHTKSALNQNFSADIDLLSVDPEELDTVKVELASRDDYSRAGVERSYLLTQLRFVPLVAADGKTVIQISSRNPIQEPFLNFLIEVNWPKGRLVREYTVLLDPPVSLQRRPEPVRAPVRAAALRNDAAPAEGPRTAESASWGEVSGNLEYGPTQPADTLWSIASNMRVAGASVEQVMMALLRHNPSAFIDNNVNLMKTGQILRLPSDDAALEITRREAREAFLEQTARWRGAAEAETNVSEAALAESIGEGVAEEAVESAEPPAEDAPEAIASAEPEETAEVVPEAELKLVSTDTQPSDEVALGEGTEDTDGQQLQQELLLAREETAIAREASEELNRRVAELEEQLADMQRLLSLQSDQLSQIQVDAEQKPADAVADDAAPDAPPAGWVERFTSDGTLMAAAGGGLLLLLGGGAAFALRRREEDEQLAESSVLAVAPESADEPGLAGQDGGGPGGLGAEEMDPELFEGDTEAVDVLTEAEVYAAYGRHDRAREMLEDAIGRQPERAELKYKLLEVYAALGDAGAFVKTAEEMNSAGADREDPAAWQNVLELGRQLVPENPLFAGGVSGTLASATEKEPGDETAIDETAGGLDFDLDLDLEELDAEQEAPEVGELVADMPEDEAPESLEETLTLEEFAPPEEPEKMEVEEPELEELTLEGFTEETDAESGEDEIGTKLDLAEAYLDMGDPEDAAGILQEVLAEGNEGQKKKAEEMLQRIS